MTKQKGNTLTGTKNRGVGAGANTGEGGKVVQTSSYKINKSWGYTIQQGSPTPGPQTGTGPRPVRNRAAQQEVSGG